MSVIQQKIIQACQHISEKGLTPSVALIKGHSAEPLPMQAIIKVLQQWKQNPQTLLAQLATPPANIKPAANDNLELRIQQLEQQVAELTAAIKMLQQAK
ncbi:hypothetical protein QX776_00730 [Alteromonadaceae bacterium BrNp21-10]|nr:hypothetical protein [Alteromonadaceae bacterium BrNp21-10]